MIRRHFIFLQKKYPFQKPLKILMTGTHGFIGSSCMSFFKALGHSVFCLSRFQNSQEPNTLYWDLKSLEKDFQSLEGFDVVIHLAGENIGVGRWTQKKKDRIMESRQKGTDLLTKMLLKVKNPPKTFIQASAVGYYGDQGDVVLDEKSRSKKGLFITDVCHKWEKASRTLETRGVRVVQARFGVVLSSSGGMLKKLLFPFKWGGGGVLGSGKQYMSWIALDDALGALYHVIMTPSLVGPVNIVAPHPVFNQMFCRILIQCLHRFEGPRLPEWVVGLLFGQIWTFIWTSFDFYLDKF